MGEAWGRCGRGHMHWGRHGGAGLLLFHTDPSGATRILLQQRAWWGSGGGTWCMFGGGRHRGEDRIAAALRETAEECTLDLSEVHIVGTTTEDHGGWDFTTVVAWAEEARPVGPASAETRAAAWVPVDQVTERRLFPPFAESWPLLRTAISRVALVVDIANVMGSRPDGWWRDRAGAAVRLRDEIAPLAVRGVTGMPEGVFGFERCFPELVLVVEGAACGVGEVEGVRVVNAPRSGDDAIVELVSSGEAALRHVVVTADRELRSRCRAAGAAVAGPRWLLDQTAPA